MRDVDRVDGRDKPGHDAPDALKKTGHCVSSVHILCASSPVA